MLAVETGIAPSILRRQTMADLATMVDVLDEKYGDQ